MCILPSIRDDYWSRARDVAPLPGMPGKVSGPQDEVVIHNAIIIDFPTGRVMASAAMYKRGCRFHSVHRRRDSRRRRRNQRHRPGGGPTRGPPPGLLFLEADERSRERDEGAAGRAAARAESVGGLCRHPAVRARAGTRCPRSGSAARTSLVGHLRRATASARSAARAARARRFAI
jgi:hypothetical protein